jgi:hypothetical protein
MNRQVRSKNSFDQITRSNHDEVWSSSERQSAGSSESSGLSIEVCVYLVVATRQNSGMGHGNIRPRDRPRSVVSCVRLLARAQNILKPMVLVTKYT